MPKTIHVLAFTNVQLLDVTGPLQVFASANDIARQQGLPPPYAPTVIASGGGAVMSSAGLALLAEPLPEQGSDTLIIAGGWGVYAAAEDLPLVAWVREHAAGCRRVSSVCTGAFLLAASGWLDGRRVVTHWTRCEQLAQQHPQLQVEPNPIFINDGPVWTSAGVTAGIDLALAMVEQDLGRDMALEVARQLVVFLKRPGGQSQFSVTLSCKKKATGSTSFTPGSAKTSPGPRHSDPGQQAGMSERSFVRHYRADTGQTPARAIELIRVETARGCSATPACRSNGSPCNAGSAARKPCAAAFCAPWA
jgi:transcriptional regulator GlxA family with amidase domain